jgi:hypothetical protein
MNSKVEEILILAERIMLHARHNVPAEAEVMDRLQRLIDEVRTEHHISPPTTPPPRGAV